MCCIISSAATRIKIHWPKLRIRRVTLDKLQCDKLEVSAMTTTTANGDNGDDDVGRMTTWPASTARQAGALGDNGNGLEPAQPAHRLPFPRMAAMPVGCGLGRRSTLGRLP